MSYHSAPALRTLLPCSEHWRGPRTGSAPAAGKGHLGDLVQLMGGDAAGICSQDESQEITLWRVRQEAALLHEGMPANALYVLRSGSLKCVKTLEDGYEQVLSFAQPGELLGFEALYCGRQPATVVALEDATAYAMPVAQLQTLRHQCAALDKALQHALSRQLVRAADTAEMMAAVASDARLARFLLWMSARMGEIGRSPQRLLLRMGRRDIASLLGVAHETVSRSFTTLAEGGSIRVDNREVDIIDPVRLRARARNTRGPLEDTAHRDERRPAAARSGPVPAAWFSGIERLSTAPV